MCVFQPDRGGAHLLLRPSEGAELRGGQTGDRSDDPGRGAATQTQGALQEPLRCGTEGACERERHRSNLKSASYQLHICWTKVCRHLPF